MPAEVTPLRATSAPPTPEPDADVSAVAAALGQVDAAQRRLRSRLAHKLGITVTDLTALVVIADAEEATPKLLATELGVASGSATAVIDRLVESGQVRRVPKAGDRRSILIELTEGGRGTIDIVSGLYLGAIAVALESSPHVFNRHILDSLRSTADALDGAVDKGLSERSA